MEIILFKRKKQQLANRQEKKERQRYKDSMSLLGRKKRNERRVEKRTRIETRPFGLFFHREKTQ